MIISHKYRLLFIEVPLTASWAIHHELCNNYDGRSILHKHATYSEFKRYASSEELRYFAFAAVRNPLDKIVSRHFKFKHDQKAIFSNPDSIPQGIMDYSDRKKYQAIITNQMSFGDYFRMFYRIPYSDMLDLSDKYLDYVIRYEKLQEGFTSMLMRLGIKQIQQLDHINKTPNKSKNFLEHYTREIIPFAKRACGPFMKKWDYHFPDEWGRHTVSLLDEIKYRSFNKLRFIYTVYLRYNNASYAIFLRKIRARLFP